MPKTSSSLISNTYQNFSFSSLNNLINNKNDFNDTNSNFKISNTFPNPNNAIKLSLALDVFKKTLVNDNARISLLSEVNTSYNSYITNINYIKCFYSNPTSLRNKSYDLESITLNSNPGLMFFTETWFKDDNVINLANYTCFYRNRPVQKGGGVCIFGRNDA